MATRLNTEAASDTKLPPKTSPNWVLQTQNAATSSPRPARAEPSGEAFLPPKAPSISRTMAQRARKISGAAGWRRNSRFIALSAGGRAVGGGERLGRCGGDVEDELRLQAEHDG